MYDISFDQYLLQRDSFNASFYMMNVVNNCNFIREKALERSNVHPTSIPTQEISIANNLLALLEDLSNSGSFNIESEDSLEFVDDGNFDWNYRIEIEDDEQQNE